MEHAFAPRKRPAVRTYGNRGAKRRETIRAKDTTATPERSRTPDAAQHSNAHRTFDSPITTTTPSTPATAPSTPRKKSRQASTPGSSPHVKLDLDKQVFQLLSPKKPKRHRMYASSDDEGSGSSDGGYQSNSPYRSQISAGIGIASISSFAARMAPRAAPRTAPRPASPLFETSHSTAHPVANPSAPSPSQKAKRDWQVADSLKPPKTKTMRTYGGSQDTSTGAESQSSSAPAQQMDLGELLLTAPPDVSAMKARWTNLDEMESDGEGEPLVRSITRLRSAGGNRRFLEEFDYLVSDLHAKQRLAAKQSTCADIARRVMGASDGDEVDGGDEAPSSSTASSFLFNVGASDVTERLCASLCAVRTGQQPDVLIDTAIATVFSRLAADINLLHQVKGMADFVRCLSDIIQADYAAKPSPKTAKSLAHLHALMRPSEIPGPWVTPSALAAQALITLLSSMALDIQAQECGLEHLTETLWSTLTDTTKQSAEGLLASDSSLCLVDLAAQALDVIIDRFAISSRPSQRKAEFATLTKLIVVLSRDVATFTAASQSATTALSSCLKLLVGMMRLHSADVDLSAVVAAPCSASTTAPASTFVEHIATLLDTSARVANEAGGDVAHKLRLLDVSTLALGVLTKLLEAAPRAACRGLMNDTQPGRENIVCKLGRLFSEREEKHDAADEAGLFAHCLAVALSLMLVSTQEQNGDDDESDTHGKRLVVELASGLALRPEQCLQHVLADNLDRFAALTSSLDQADGDAQDKASDDNLVRHLSLRLRNL